MTAEKEKNDMPNTSIGLRWSAADNLIQVVRLRRSPQGIEFQDFRTFPLNSSVSESLRHAIPANPGDGALALAVGIDSSCVGFYRLEVPSLPAPQLVAVVRTQAEGYLPLPVSAMRLAWRIDKHLSENRCILTAVKNDLYEHVSKPLPADASVSIAPDLVGLLTAWRTFFHPAPGPQETVLLKLTPHQVSAVLAEEGRLLGAARIDIDPQAPLELLKTDLIQMLESLTPQIRSKPIFVLDTQADPFPSLIDDLRQENFQVQPCRPSPEKTKRLARLTPETAADCPEALGLALLALDGQAVDFDFTIEQTEPAPSLRQQLFSAPVRRTALSLVLAVVLVLIGLYWKDKTELRILQQQLSTAEKGQTAQQMLQMMEFRKQVAAARPDLLELLDLLRQTQPEGLLLDQFLFERGKPVELRGVAASYEQAYQFQKNLQQRNELRQVQLIEPTLDEKTKKVNFRIRFLYRNFSG
ncbi:MAG TPA: PilN domain-containing protein [Anaerohalosphaeraceae bacterium]|nr:PilN domain-containing protein [Anaerohalosphaeraceae bacterium]HOL89757.1 PilN domain-containing protein [Anaerohalosphaeraceae bacterium]HPP57203.1 PilN domain-containing protein [Anaerohalosphaeraceae bacterium]